MLSEKKKRMLKYATLLICLLVVFSCKVTKDNKSVSSIPIEDSLNIKLDFPEDWLGYWQGDLNIYSENGLQQTIPMALDNSSTNVPGQYTWAIIYGTDTISGRRDYQLEAIDTSKGHYRVDEKNGILLDAYLIDNELISVFEVMGNSLTSVYKREDNSMIFEIMMFKSQYDNITGDTIIGTDTIPPVKSYKPIVRQKATLKRRN